MNADQIYKRRWKLLEQAAGSASILQPFFAQAASDNINVIRAFGHGSTPSLVLQPSPGKQAHAAWYVGVRLLLERLVAL